MIYHYKEVPVFYNLSGSGPVMVLLHGFLESSTMWSRFVPKLSGNKTILTIDLPGHGKSGCIAKTHSMELMATVVFSLLNYLKIEKASFVGHSMGGYVVLAFAEAYKQKATCLVLINSTSEEDSLERKLNRERALKLISKNKAAFINLAIPHLFTEESQLKYTQKISDLKKEAHTFSVAGIVAAIRGMKDRKDRTELLENFKNKKYIICGEDDPIVSVSTSKKIARTTHSELLLLQGGHMSWIENELEVLQVLHLID